MKRFNKILQLRRHTKLKRFSRSATSVVLAVCLLISCMTVGLIATDAAKVTGEKVGASSTYTVYFRNNGNWSNVYVLTGSNLNMSGSDGAYEDLYGSNINNFTAMSLVPGETKVYKASVTVYDNKIAFASANSTQSGYYASNGQICCVGNMASGKVVNMWTDTWTSRNGAAYKKYNLEDYTPPTPNITGINGDWSTGDAMTHDSGNNYYYAFNGDSNDKYFRFKFNSKYYEAYNNNFNLETDGTYKPYDGSTDNKKYGTRESNGNAFKLTANSSYSYRIYFDISTKKTWFTKTERTHSVSIKQQLGSGSATNVSTSTIGNVTGVNVTANASVTSGGNSYTFDHWAISGGTVSVCATQNGTYTTKTSGSTYATRNMYVKTASDSAVLTAVYTLNLSALSAPTNVKLNGSAANCTVTATTVGAKINLTWDSVTNAGSYKVYKGNSLVTTVTTTSYSIERANSSTGAYSVVAVPSNTNAYSESVKSTAYTLTVNKKTLSAPTVSVTPTAIALGSSVELTATDENSGVTTAQYNLYYYESSLSATDAYKLTSGTAKTITPTTAGSHTYKVVAYPVNGSSNDYYTQSSATSATAVGVYSPSYYLVGDLVDSTNNKWSNSLTSYPVDEYVSANVFKRTVTYATGNNSDKHYFRLNTGSAQYTVTSGSYTNMSGHNTSASALTASAQTTNGAMYVTGQGTFTIYVDQSTSGSPKVWVVATEAQKYTTIVYVNKDSGATNMYVWKDNNNEVSAWPGEDITTVEETVNDIKYYKYTFESYWDHFDIVVNKGSGNNQCADLTNIAASKTYYVVWDGGANTPASISEAAPVLQLGYKVQNGSSVSHADFANRSVTVSLSANTTYEFWIKSTNSHLNDQNSGTMNRSNCTGWHFPMNETNTKIQADLAGNYTFTYTVTNGEIYVSVTYPPEPKYSVTVNQGDHGTVKVNENNFTSGNTIQIGSITTASVEAVPASGYHFTGWTTSGGVAAVSGYTTSSNPITINASAAGTLTATYAEDSYTVTLASAGNGSITTPSSKTLTAHPITPTSLSGVTVTPANGYKFNGWTEGTGITLSDNSATDPSAGTIKTNRNSTLTAKFTKVSYTLTGKTSLNGTVGNYGTVTFYSNSTCTTQITTAQIGNTVYAKFTSDDYALVSFTKSGTGSSGGTTTGNVYSFTMGYGAVTVTANVKPLSSVTYYVDMHDNSVSTMSIAIVQNMGGTVVKDGNGKDCSATLGDTSGDYQLTKQGNSTVYAATIATPVTLSGSTYSDIYLRITFNGTNYENKISGGNTATSTCIVDDLINTGEIWLEAENEASAKLTVNYSTRSTPTVASGNRRIYVAKPYSWQTEETNWQTLGIYHWGDYTDIGWSNGIRMNYLGYSGTGANDYHYYYVDIPKTISGNKVSNIIFQGWNSTSPAANTSPNAQTGNIENIPDSANFFILSKDGSAYVGTKSEEDAVIPNYTRYVSSVTMNKTEQTEVFVKPTYTGNRISYESNNTNVVTVDRSTGKITPVGRGTTTITVQIYGTIGNLVTNEDNDHKDYLTYTVNVTVKDPTQFNGFEIMSLESKTYTVKIPNLNNEGKPVDQGGTLPGYFDMSNVVMTVEGIHGVASSTSSAIITQTATASVSDIGTVCTAFTVKYAKANNLFDNYGNIRVTGKVVTMSIARSGGQRYGHDHWEADGNTVSFTTTRVINNAVETATTNSIAFDSTKTTYSAIFAAYSYVDVTFTFKYYEYNPELAEGGMINYFYDSNWAGTETFGNTFNKKVFTVNELENTLVKGDWSLNTTAGANTPSVTLDISSVSSLGGNWCAWTWGENEGRWITGTKNGNIITFADDDVDNSIIFVRMNVGDAMDWNNAQNKTEDLSSRSHNLRTYTVSSYEVRNKTADNITTNDLATAAAMAIGDAMPSNNYYNYTITAAKITKSKTGTYTADATVNMTQNVMHYSVYLNGKLLGNNYTYQQYAEPTVDSASDWYAVDGKDSIDTSNAPLLATNVNSYKFRVKGSANSNNTYLRTTAATNAHGNAFIRSEVDFSHYEITHNNNLDYLLQNFYIADFFSPSEVLDPNSNNGQGNLPYDDAQFVGGGVVYYSMNGVTENNPGTPFANAVSAGYVDGNGTANANAVKDMLKANIEAQYDKDDIADKVGNEEAMKIAYGTEITAKKNVEGGFNTGIIYRYLPLNEYKRDDHGKLIADSEGKYTYDVNSNTFRYSNSLQSYQYVYASGNENKATNSGKNMRLYSYYIYSYVAYNQETNVPETRYEVVLSDNYADASTYWAGNTNDPNI